MLTAGFADPVRDAQASFRAVLEAMSRPGRVQRLGGGLHPPAPLNRAAAAAVLALVDADTPLWHDAGAPADGWLRFHCGAPMAAAPREAAFLLATAAAPALAALDPGSEEEPERGATLVVQVAVLEEGAGWRLAGPGIAQEHRLRVRGLPGDFLRQWTANRAAFPRGVDVLLCADDRLAALPRTVTIAEG